MQILQLCKKFPYPLKDGESFAVTNLARALVNEGVELDLLAFNTSKHYVDINSLPLDFNHYNEVHTIDLDNRIKKYKAFQNLFSKRSFHIERFEKKAFHDELEGMLQMKDYDVILLESVFMAPYVNTIRKFSNAKIIMRAHNVEFEIWDRVASNSPFVKKLYLKYLNKKLRKYEIESLARYDHLVALTQRDLDFLISLGYAKSSSVLAIGVDLSNLPLKSLRKSTHKLKIGFIGSLDWVPNIDGLNWFLDDVWSNVYKENKHIELHIAGRNMSTAFLNKKIEGVWIHGEVDDAQKFTISNDLMIVPLFSGSGMRVKIIESMSLSRVVISTDIGIEGIDAKCNIDYLKANNADEFVTQILYCYNNREEVQIISNNANNFITSNFDSKINANKWIDVLQKLLEN